MQCGPVQAPYVLWRPVWGKYRACRTHMYGCLLDHARLTTGPKSPKVHFRKLYMLIFQPQALRPHTGPKASKKHTNPQGGHPPSLIRVFAMRLIGKQGHKASSNEQRSPIKLSWAYMQFRFCSAQVHISVVTYFHNNSLIAWVETNRIKTLCFEAMSNVKWKQKYYIY